MKNVLIADDERRIVQLMKSMIDWADLDLHLACEVDNGIDALAIVEQGQIDILIADIKMPGLDGLQLAERAMEACPNISVIIVSGYREFDFAYNALKKGVCDYLIKPINRQDLNKSLRRILNQNQPDNVVLRNEMIRLQREKAVSNALHGILDNQPTLDAFNKTYCFHCKPGIFCALSATIPVRDKEVNINGILDKIKDLTLATLSNVCFDLECVIYQASCYCLLNFDREKSTAVKQELKNLQSEIDRRITGEFSIPVLLCVSSFQHGCADLYRSFEETQKCAKCYPLLGNRDIIFAEKLKLDIPRSILTQQQIMLLSTTMARFNYDALAACLIQVFSDIYPILRQQPWQLDFFLHEILFSFSAALGKEKIDVSNSTVEDFIATLQTNSSWEALTSQMLQWMQGLVDQYNNMFADQYRSPIRHAMNYIEEHFAEDISLSDICADVNFSYSYFSMLFKQETGESVTDYITRIRIRHAQELLATTTASVQSVAQQCGYSDTKHFSKTFNKLIGIRPLEYRKLKF